MAKKLYKIIGVDENADDHAITRSYRKQALKYHPDKQVGKSDREINDADNKFKELSAAYAILNDPQKRKDYDTGRINDKGEYDAGSINDKGEKVGQAQDSFNQQSREEPRVRRQSPSGTNQPHPAERPFSRSHNPFFKPQPAHYFFFNNKTDATSFRPQQARGPHFVYVTTSPLQSLFEIINASLGQNHEPKLSRSTQKSHVAANGDSSTYHQETNQYPEHVSVKTNDAPRVERMIDHLIGQLILLQLLEKLSQSYGNESQHESSSRPGPGF